MKLDPRIKDGKKPLTCFDAEEAKSFIGKACYFTNNLREYADLTTVTAKRTLGRVGSYFYAEFDSGMYAYCLPCDWVTEEKKYRPFRYINELQECGIKVGKILAVRNINYPEVTRSVIVSEVNYDPETLEVINITLGATGYEFSTLFNSYQLMVNGEWKPFGVEE